MSNTQFGILGRKLGMTQIFDDAGNALGVTVLDVGSNVVIRVKTSDSKDGYAALQLGFGTQKESRVTKARLGHFQKAGVGVPRYVREVRLTDDVAKKYSAGQALGADVFAAKERVDVSGVSKGRGFAGVMKRHGFSGLETGHGVQRKHRAPGSIGSNTSPGRVRKGVRMNGQYGNTRTTVRNLKVIRVDPANNLILVEGGVPGPNGGFVIVRKTNKKVKYVAPGAAPPSKKKK